MATGPMLRADKFGHDFVVLPPDPPPPPAREEEKPIVSPWATASAEDVLAAATGYTGSGDKRIRGARLVLAHLATLPGDTWLDRWLLVDAQSSRGGAWHHLVVPDIRKDDCYLGEILTSGLGTLMVLDVVRPTLAWLSQRICGVARRVLEHRDPEGMAQFRAAVEGRPIRLSEVNLMEVQLGKVALHTGKTVRQISADDLLELQSSWASRGHGASGMLRSLELNWRVLKELGWIHHDQVALPRYFKRKGRMTITEMVDYYGITGPPREVFIEYFKQRSASADYSTLRNNANRLLNNFWADIVKHHPEQTSFALTREVSAAWKERVRTKPNGEPRIGFYQNIYLVRAFYLDMAQWALHDSYWAQWVAPCPVTRAEVTGYGKLRRKQIARLHHRTLQLAPTLPQLVRQATLDRRETRRRLDDALAAGVGNTVELDGQTWTVTQSGPHSPIRMRNGDASRNLSREEDVAFWTWAIIETLRHTGIRCEELLELTHLSIVPYTVPGTGEEIALLHIAPSKTDEERLLVASPELVNALAAVIHRIRDGQEQVPLTHRWDTHERELSIALPHLFARRAGSELRPMNGGTVLTFLADAAKRAGLAANGEALKFTTHDFRRVFATDALASGLPPHIVQALLGHKSLATTQGYAAIYPQDVIRHHRTYVAQRRQMRPSEEYRQPTAAEWEEFEGHFVKRKLSLGSCGRAYGTNCSHEPACVRCALLHVDPDQADRLREIVTDLQDRIVEAEQNAWLGEVEGLKTTLAAAEEKLASLEQEEPGHPVLLPTPTMRPYAGMH